MKRRGPLLTLAAVAVLAIVLLVINVSKESDSEAPVATSQPAVTSSPVVAEPTTTAAPSVTPFPAKADYVGEVATATGAITLSIAVEGDKAIAYACDGKAIESWLQGSATNGVLNLAGKNNSRLEGSLDGPNVTGTLWIGDKSWNFIAAPVQPPAGLYVYQDNGTRDSWIVAADGTVTGVQRGADGATAPAPALSPDGKAVVNGRTVTATQVSGGDSNVF